MRRFYEKFINPGDLCFDIGANRGERLDAFNNLGALVIAVEPQLNCVRRLKSTFGHLDNVKILDVAIGESDGEAILRTSTHDSFYPHASMSQSWIEVMRDTNRFDHAVWDEGYTVSIVTLDRLIQRFGTPKFIKIDVEGYEYNVLKGLHQAIQYIIL